MTSDNKTVRQIACPTARLLLFQIYSMHADDTIAAHVPIRGLAYAKS